MPTENISIAELSLSFFILAVVYLCLIAVPLIQLVRITHTGIPLFKATTQKIFLAALLCTATFRTSFFIIVPLTNRHDTFNITEFSNHFLTFLDDFGCLLFFSTFTLLILFWAEITLLARNRRSVYSKRVRPLYIASLILVWVIQIVIWTAIFTTSKPLVDQIDNIFYSLISVVAAVGFFYFGGHLYLMLKNNPIESAGRKSKLREVLYITAICTSCFIGRSILYVILTFEPSLSVNPLTVAVYYVVSEILPAFIVLFVLRKLPPPKPTHSYPEVNAPLLTN